MLGVRIVDCHTRYLGLPTIIGQSKHRLFNYVRDMLWNKLHMWNAKLLSMAGKEVLIKAVAQALPTYIMGVFQLPKSLCQELSAMVVRFWLGKSAGYGQSPSLIWRSILWGRQVIEQGLIWRIGGGTSVRVFHDKWIPKPYTFLPLINRGLLPEAKVSDLITTSSGWNRTLLDLSFCDEDCAAILSIPLPSVGSLEDKRFWFFSKNGKYSVKTGYRLDLRLCDKEVNGEIGGSNSGTQRAFWKKLWHLEVPNKVKILLWKASLNIFPTALNLVQRKVSGCGTATEDVIHAFWGCKHSKRVWKLRNEVLYRKTVDGLPEIVEWTMEFLEQFLKYIILAPSQQGGVGGALRDSAGNFILGFADQGPAGLDVLATECVAIHMGLLKAAELGVSDFLVASNSQEVVALLKGNGELWSNLGNIVDDIRRLLAELCVRDVFFQPRSGNRVAHSLAQFGLREQHHSFWDGLAPDWLVSLLVTDMEGG
ncbi:unnamed protein product [Prunus armeniaca]